MQVDCIVIGRQVVMDGNPQQAICHFALYDKKRVLQVDLVLGCYPLVGEFAKGKAESARGWSVSFVSFMRQYSNFCPSGTK